MLALDLGRERLRLLLRAHHPTWTRNLPSGCAAAAAARARGGCGGAAHLVLRDQALGLDLGRGLTRRWRRAALEAVVRRRGEGIGLSIEAAAGG